MRKFKVKGWRNLDRQKMTTQGVKINHAVQFARRHRMDNYRITINGSMFAEKKNRKEQLIYTYGYYHKRKSYRSSRYYGVRFK